MKTLLANLALAATVLQLPLAAAVIGKKLWRSFPVFTAYSLTNLVAAVVLYGTRRIGPSSYAYFYTYWAFEGIAVVLGFGVVYEVFRELLQPYAALRRIATVTFRWVLAGLIVLACIVAYARPSGLPPIMAGIEISEEAARVVEVGLLVFLFGFSRAFGLHWRQNIFGIALGLGVFTSVELAAVTMHTLLGQAAYQAFNLARGLSFNASLLIWMGYIFAPERVTSTAQLPQRAQLEQWNQAMMELIQQ
jgi:hypothetical protein